MKYLSIVLHILLIAILTIVTQIGGIIWGLSLMINPGKVNLNRRLFQFLAFCTLYLIFTFLLVPSIAPFCGRSALPMTKYGTLAPHTYMTVLLNRHYVTPQLRGELEHISRAFSRTNPNLKVVYLDANFPFINGFPLLPHLSHDDGKKVDLSFIYSKNGKPTNLKPARSGYGYYTPPQDQETDQINQCISRGYWQYDFPKYLTIGSRKDLSFAPSETYQLLELILKRKLTQKVFLEPHIKHRLKIHHPKLRYHGCQSVRHDDHIHYQIQ